jgi:propionyl-CoA carboxylase alpha chain
VFRKILIANRGEIACRIIRTARRMGIATVAVYSDADRDALHVEMADEAVAIGPPPASQSYLVIDRIVAACRQTGADAVHPGYGFLSEQTAFAEALAAAGVAFVGPNPRAIAAMGDKIESKKLAAAAGVSTVPGQLASIESDAAAIAAVRAVGLPVMIKASAGGGGKGMRIAWHEKDVAEGVRAARSEAKSSFGDDRVFVERYIEHPRHIEMQVLGDKHGNVVTLGERECSIQRRNQKIVEEAPSPAVDPATRKKMSDEAAALARAVGYDSAGTVEFIMDVAGKFYFLEMNTRLQVEHPVTEFITGLDLVEQMIRVAAGERLAFGQRDVALAGWAIETRLYAEDPLRNFLPSIGRLTRYQPPPVASDGGASVRVDSGVTEGSEISVYYDPLIAKLITHAATREAATAAMARALDQFVVDGVANNRSFLAAVMATERWREGRLSTDFIAEEFPEGFAAAKPDRATVEDLAHVAVAIALRDGARLRRLTGRLDAPSRSPAREWVVAIGGEYLSARAEVEDDGSYLIAVGQEPSRAIGSAWRPGEAVWTGTIGDRQATVQVRRKNGRVVLSERGVTILAEVMAPHIANLAALMPVKRDTGSSKQLRCPMPGLVRSINVKPGQRVAAGEPLAIVEAMKMENVLLAEQDATVSRVLAQPGDTLAVDAVILEFA